MVQIPSKDAHKNLEILFQFGGEKSLSKISKYEYNLSANLLLGDVTNESIYLVEKRENTLPSDFSNNTDDDHVNQLLDT
ncbi:hypothetical protein [Chryseobacterium caseinilyticum]|uniref:Uncharacterized protein n=1 Tax=Chryseobacterium caseinilyticum TaxID=2771428 RepID=A0ABR8ZFJ3_9FLAO|nr:hypothetical protein [Chryseobacterium caseinilyticum]MBD8083864.1 hypothetical protein [Chryseobacterium caseinilyticum]